MTAVEINTSKLSSSSTTMAKKYSPSDQSIENTVTTTVSDSSSVLQGQETKKSSSRRKKSSSSKSNRRKNKRENRAALVGMIAQEVTDTWTEHQQAPGTLPEEEAPTAAELFYALMNGEQVSSSSNHSMRSKESSSSYTNFGSDDEFPILPDNDQEEDDDVEFSDHTSFANLDLPRDIQDDLSEGKLSSSRRSTYSRSGSTASESSNSTDSSHLSIEEIQNMVMAQLPEDVRNQIPKEAWGKIFAPTVDADKTRMPTGNCILPTTEEDEKEEGKEQYDDEDDSSVISDITMHNFAVNKIGGKKKKKAAAAPAVPMAPCDADECLHQEKHPFFDDDRFEELCSFRDERSIATGSQSKTTTTTAAAADSTATSVSKTRCAEGVRFGNVQVRFYQRIMDINPSVTNGVAIGIGWKFKRGGVMPVDDWENRRGGYTRKSNDLILPKHVRDAMLKDLGYTQKDFAAATRSILKAKQQRKVAVQNQGSNQQLEEAVENATRKVMGLLSFGKKKGLV